MPVKFNRLKFGTKTLLKGIILISFIFISFYILIGHKLLFFNRTSESTQIVKFRRTNNKYLLLWTNANDIPFNYLGKGQSVFKERNCEWYNCYVTDDKNYLGHYTEFDAIAFNGPSLSRTFNFPLKRSQHQKYIFASIESSYNYPVCSNKFNNYFNWTWTYKLNSDAYWSYMIIRDSSGKVVGPSTEMKWLELLKMEPIDENLKNKLNIKTKAAVWFVSNCLTSNNRNTVAKAINYYLKAYNLSLDIYGKCGNLECPTDQMEHCLRMVERDYYFYFAFENSFSEDYVTEKILNALRHNIIPIVYGGANYTRFMADYMYLNAKEISPKKLARLIYTLTSDRNQYYDFFRWKKYYSYHFKWESPETDDYCHFCKMLNDEVLIMKTSMYKSFTEWWNPKGICKY